MIKKMLYGILACVFLTSSGYATEPIIKHLKTDELVNAYLDKTIVQMQYRIKALQKDCELEELLQAKDEENAEFAPYVKTSMKKQLVFLNKKLNSIQDLLPKSSKKNLAIIKIIQEIVAKMAKKLNMTLDGRVSGQDIGGLLIGIFEFLDGVRGELVESEMEYGSKITKIIIGGIIISLVTLGIGQYVGWWDHTRFVINTFNTNGLIAIAMGLAGLYYKKKKKEKHSFRFFENINEDLELA